jgi:hypothetical protein
LEALFTGQAKNGKAEKTRACYSMNAQKEKGRLPCGHLPFNAVGTAVLLVLDFALLPLHQTYCDAPVAAAGAASADAAFLCVDFLCDVFLWCVDLWAVEAAAAGAAAGAVASEACAKAADANRPATRAAISLFICKSLA